MPTYQARSQNLQPFGFFIPLNVLSTFPLSSQGIPTAHSPRFTSHFPSFETAPSLSSCALASALPGWEAWDLDFPAPLASKFLPTRDFGAGQRKGGKKSFPPVVLAALAARWLWWELGGSRLCSSCCRRNPDSWVRLLVVTLALISISCLQFQSEFTAFCDPAFWVLRTECLCLFQSKHKSPHPGVLHLESVPNGVN